MKDLKHYQVYSHKVPAVNVGTIWAERATQTAAQWIFWVGEYTVAYIWKDECSIREVTAEDNADLLEEVPA